MDQQVMIIIAVWSILAFLLFAMGVAHWQERRDKRRDERRRHGETPR